MDRLVLEDILNQMVEDWINNQEDTIKQGLYKIDMLVKLKDRDSTLTIMKSDIKHIVKEQE